MNLFVLDIEGFELAVLRAIDWNKVDIEVRVLDVQEINQAVQCNIEYVTYYMELSLFLFRS